MRKIYLFLFIISLPLPLSAQWYGNGLSSVNAYYGVINSSNTMQTWNITNYPGGVIYVGRSTAGQNDLEVSGGGTLTIEQGITVKFCTATSDLRITGTGLLNASGSSSSFVTFTKDAQASWGHISLESMTTTNPENYPSVIDYCIIEYGDVSSTSLLPANPNQYGGAIHADFSYLTISNCEFKNNKAGWGGGVFVGDGKNPSISNCYFHDNTATTSGGGIYFWKNSSSAFSNSIISSNNCSGAGGGGGIFIGGIAKDVKVINCVITSNSANNQTLGHNIKIFSNTNSPKPQFFNSIIWNPANSIVGSIYTTDFVNCAIQDPPLSYPTCISLNSLNEGTSPDGPFFATMSGDSWTLQFRSPCRDAGTTPSPTVPNDYLGKLRIGAYDIGAYEVQYSRWDGSTGTNWGTASNWEPDPTPVTPVSSISDVIIPSGLSNYPTTSSPDFAIGSGHYMIIEAGAQATFNSLANNSGGTLRLESDVSGIFSLMMTSYSGTGTSNVEMYLTGGGGPNYNWHYVAVPTYINNKTVFTDINAYNLLQYDDSYVVTSNYQGWVWHDGYDSVLQDLSGPSFSDLVYGKGYNFYHNQAAGYATATFSVSTLGATLPTVYPSYNGGADDNTLFGLNLLGNSLTCSIDWDEVTKSGNMRNAIYFTQGNQMVSYVNEVGVPDGTTGIIPPLQGFFIKAQSVTGVSIDFSGASVKTHGDVNRYKKGSAEIIPLVRLQLLNGSKVEDETVVRLDDKATLAFDNTFDASKLFPGSINSAQLYTKIDNEEYVINSIPFPSDSYIVPLVIKITAEGSYQILKTQLQGLENYKITLKDKDNGNFIVDFDFTDKYIFSSAAGTFANRFELLISKSTTGVSDMLTNKKDFNIYSSGEIVNILPLNDNISDLSGGIKIVDIMGRVIKQENEILWNSGSLVQIHMSGARGLYFVEVLAGNIKTVGKVVLK